MKISFHTDAFASAFWNFEKCLAWAQKNNVRYIESGIMDGVSWIHGLGYWPHVSTHEDPVLLREKMEKYGVRFSQIDAAYPLSGLDGPTVAVPYILRCMQWAKLAGCPHIATTDGLDQPEGLTDEEAMEQMKRSYSQIIEVAEKYQIYVTIEIHGYFTTKPDYVGRMLEFVDSKYLRMNMDTGNSFIAGNDPVAFAKRFLPKIKHVHVKDVSQELAAASRGEETGIALSHSAIGDGVNADNIKSVLKMLKEIGYDGHISMECEGQGGPLIERSLAWLRKTFADLGIQEDFS